MKPEGGVSHDRMGEVCVAQLAAVFAIESMCSPYVSVGDRGWSAADRALHVVGTVKTRGNLGFLFSALGNDSTRQTT